MRRGRWETENKVLLILQQAEQSGKSEISDGGGASVRGEEAGRPRALQRPAVSQRVEDNPSGQIVSLLAGRSRSISSVAAHSPNSNSKKQTEYHVSTHLKQIQKKKEELFNLIAELDSKLPSHCNRDNRALLMDLSAHVQPKPNDPQWRWYRGAKRCKNYVTYGGMLFLGYLSVSDEISGLYAVLVE